MQGNIIVGHGISVGLGKKLGMRDSEKLVGSVEYSPLRLELVHLQGLNWWQEGRMIKIDIQRGTVTGNDKIWGMTLIEIEWMPRSL